ncbi:hypothetical protein [Pseudanabaena phage PA-SR01]|nr:hypothetical protein [Pseudanabaena phage PA-SR01]
MKTKNFSQEQLLTSFLHRACDLSSSGLQIDCDGHLYASGEMIAAWQNEILFIDCGSSKVYNRRATNELKELAEKEEIKYVLYNKHSYPISPDFRFVERLVSYPIWATPNDVNSKNIFAQSKKLLDKAIEKQVSYESIQQLINSIQHIASLFDFEFDATQYETKQKQLQQEERDRKKKAAQWHLEQYTRITKELEAS